MKVLQVVPGTSPKYGGPHVALIDMTRLLRAQGIEVSLITTNIEPTGRLSVPIGVPINIQGAPVVYFKVWPCGRYAFSPGLARTLFKTVRNYDVVHIHWLYNFSSLAAAIAARRARVPYVVQPNGSLDPHLMRKNRIVKKTYLALFGRYILEDAAALLPTSKKERDQAPAIKKHVSSHVVPVGLDWAKYVALPARGQFRQQVPEIQDKRIVLFLGRIGPQKGLDLLIPAFRKVAKTHPDIHLVLAGPDGEGYSSKVRAWVKDAGLSKHVTFAGYVPVELKLAAYVDSEVYVLPSYGENFGATVTEALACKTPVVISDHVNICDEIERAQAGIIVQCSVDSVAEGIARVLDNPGGAESMGQRGRALVEREFTWEVALQRLIAVYQSVAVGHGFS